jgi:hypothetical protein
MDLFACPAPTAIATIPATSCPIRWDQVQKMLIRRISGAQALTTSTVLLSATITPLLSAADSTKLIVSPFIHDFKIPQSEVLKEGGNDNTTINGVPTLRGLGFVGATGMLKNISAAAAAKIRAITPETATAPGETNIEALFVNKDGKVIAQNPASTTVKGFPIYNLALTDVGSEGFGKDNIYNLSFDLAPGWSEYHAMYTPTDWNALTVANS